MAAWPLIFRTELEIWDMNQEDGRLAEGRCLDALTLIFEPDACKGVVSRHQQSVHTPGLNGIIEDKGEYCNASSTVRSRGPRELPEFGVWIPLLGCNGV